MNKERLVAGKHDDTPPEGYVVDKQAERAIKDKVIQKIMLQNVAKRKVIEKKKEQEKHKDNEKNRKEKIKKNNRRKRKEKKKRSKK